MSDLPWKFSLGRALGRLDDAPCEACADEVQPEHDQWHVPRDRSVFWAVAIHHDTGHKHPKSIIGPYGHIERLNVWTHLVATLVFALYAIVRRVVLPPATTQDVMVVVAAWSTAFTFGVSTVYHTTAPRPELAFFTRVADYLAIYLSISVTSLADMAVATKGFDLVKWQTIVDIPLAALLIGLFFILRRAALTTEQTLAPTTRGCPSGLGLFRSLHQDNEHSALRASTSFVLSTAWFLVVPTTVQMIPLAAAVFISLEAVALLVLLVGMTIDNVFNWPDTAYARGERFGCSNRRCGCLVTSHALWHIFAFVAALLSAAAREYGIAVTKLTVL